MNATSSAMNQYLLLLRDDPAAFEAMSPEEMQACIQRYTDWRQGLEADGRLVGAEKLRDGEGRVASRNGDGIAVKDGPFTEAKEVVGGFFLIRAAGYDEALELCRDCPHYDFGSIEVREIEEH